MRGAERVNSFSAWCSCDVRLSKFAFAQRIRLGDKLSTYNSQWTYKLFAIFTTGVAYSHLSIYKLFVVCTSLSVAIKRRGVLVGVGECADTRVNWTERGGVLGTCISTRRRTDIVGVTVY